MALSLSQPLTSLNYKRVLRVISSSWLPGHTSRMFWPNLWRNSLVSELNVHCTHAYGCSLLTTGLLKNKWLKNSWSVKRWKSNSLCSVYFSLKFSSLFLLMNISQVKPSKWLTCNFMRNRTKWLVIFIFQGTETKFLSPRKRQI